ncbi:MAG: cysteine hydrolase family protein [Clostridium sp.]|uniref:cysteine hydrolase family protein n=1 Tax=Clostridium sp. TaxID=1506 RepID=UPI003EE5E816
MVLLVVDTQKLLVNEKLYNFEGFVSNIEALIERSRENNIQVIYVVHDEGKESDLTKGKEGFEIYENFQALENEKIFVKSVNSSFKETGLLEYLREKNEKDIIIVGLQTDKCIDATVKSGFEHGFNMIVPIDANSTVDNEFLSREKSHKYYNEYIWPNRYAKCVSMDEIFNLVEGR